MNNLESNTAKDAIVEQATIVLKLGAFTDRDDCPLCGEMVFPFGDLQPPRTDLPRLFLEGAVKRAPALVASRDLLMVAVNNKKCGCFDDEVGEFVMMGSYSFQICREHGKFREYRYYPPPQPLTVVRFHMDDGFPGDFLTLFKGLTPFKAEDGVRLLNTIRCSSHTPTAWPECCGDDIPF